MMSQPSQSTQKIIQPNPSKCIPVTPMAPHWYNRSTRSASASISLISCCENTTSSQWLARSTSSSSMASCWLVSLRWQRQLSISSRRLAVSSVLGDRLLALQQASACSLRQACVRKVLVCPASISVVAACSNPRRVVMPLSIAVVSASQARLLRNADLFWLRSQIERGVSSWSRNWPSVVSGLKSLGNLSCVLRKQSLAMRSLNVVSSLSKWTIPRLSGLKLSTISMVFQLQRHSMALRALPADTPCTSFNPRSIIQIGNGMRASKGKTGSLWLRGSKPQSSACIEELPDFGMLKREAKKIEIMTRMDRRAKTNESSFTCTRPKSTTAPRGHQKTLSFKQVEGLYRKEKSLMRETLAQTQPSREQGHLGGLLGEWQRYQQLSKKELIEKLISLEHLANAIFKKNKHLEEELEAVRQQQRQ